MSALGADARGRGTEEARSHGTEEVPWRGPMAWRGPWHGRGAVPSEVGPLRASLEKKKEAPSAGKCRCMPAGRCMENKKSSLNDCRFCHRLLFSLGQNLNILEVIKKSIWQESSSSEILQGMSIHSLRQHFGDGHVKQARHLPLFSKF